MLLETVLVGDKKRKKMKNIEIQVRLLGSNECYPLLKFMETRSLEISETRDTKTIVVGLDPNDDLSMGVGERFRNLLLHSPDCDPSNN
jgi:hypothetical protein